MNGGTAGAWTTIAAASIQKPITISGLTPTTIYGFQVQALGVLGYSDWSPITTIIDGSDEKVGHSGGESGATNVVA